MGNCLAPEPAAAGQLGPTFHPHLSLPAGLGEGGSSLGSGTGAKAAPQCQTCGVSGYIALGRMAALPRALWVERDGSLSCKRCLKKKKKEWKLFQKEWQLYKKMKDNLYPRPKRSSALKPIQSGKRWDNTDSFKSSPKGSPVVSFNSN